MTITARCLPAPESEPHSWQWEPPTQTWPDQQLPLPAADNLPEKPPAIPAHDPDLRPVATWFARIIGEAIHGQRPLAQLAPRFDTRAMIVLSNRLPFLRSVRASVASVHVQSPTEAVAEVTVRLSTTSTHMALAMRLEHTQAQWTCVALVIG